MTGFRKTLVALSALLAGTLLFLGYVYFKDTGIEDKGYARLHYNWRYVFAEKPKQEYKYDGKLFSFTYLPLTNDDPIKTDERTYGGFLWGYRLELDWSRTVPSDIRSELNTFLTSKDKTDWAPSLEFQKWLFAQTDLFSATKTEKLKFKDGTPAALIIVKAKKIGWRGNFRYLVSIAPGGIVIKVKNTFGSAIPYARHLRHDTSGMEIYSPFLPHISPDPERDFWNLYVFRRFIETFEFKK